MWDDPRPTLLWHLPGIRGGCHRAFFAICCDNVGQPQYPFSAQTLGMASIPSLWRQRHRGKLRGGSRIGHSTYRTCTTSGANHGSSVSGPTLLCMMSLGRLKRFGPIGMGQNFVVRGTGLSVYAIPASCALSWSNKFPVQCLRRRC